MKSIGAAMIVLAGSAMFFAGAVTRQIGPTRNSEGENFGILLALVGVLSWLNVAFCKSDDRQD
jgi:hypothetical protein